MSQNLLSLCFCLVFLFPFYFSGGANTYYIDNLTGNDSNSGKRPRKAWATISKVNESGFRAGDRILFRGGQAFEGTVHLKNLVGEKEKKIVISSFGKGHALICGLNAEAFIADSCSYLQIKNMEFTGSGRKSGNTTSGLLIRGGSNIEIDSVKVSAFQKSGVDIRDAENISVLRVHAYDNGFAGIQTGVAYHSPFKLVSKNIYIGYCTVENNPGDPTILNNHSGSGILVSGTNGAVIEYCLARNNGWDQPWEGNGPIGIWAYHSDNVLIQHCISHSNKTNPKGWDGGGFDFDGGVTNSVMQYNLSYNNAGPGYGLYQYAGAGSWENNILRYNISYNDGIEIDSCGLQIWNGQPDKPTFKNASIYNNLFINDYGKAVNYKSGNIPGIYYWNNIFASALGPVTGERSLSVFENNLYWQFGREIKFNNSDAKAIYSDPMLNLPNPLNFQFEEPVNLKHLEFFKLLSGSPCFEKGIDIKNRGDFDFWGNLLPEDSSKLNIGPWQIID